MAFSFWLAWNVTTRRALIGISSPVLGLRPGRCGLSRSWKLPKPESFTLSPRSSAPRISSKNASTMSFASRLLRPTFSNNRSASSAFVNVIVQLPQTPLLTQACSEFAAQEACQRVPGDVGLRIRECAFSILHNYPESKAFLPRRDAGSLVEIKDTDGGHDRRLFALHGVQKRLRGDVGVHEHRDVAHHRRVLGRGRKA